MNTVDTSIEGQGHPQQSVRKQLNPRLSLRVLYELKYSYVNSERVSAPLCSNVQAPMSYRPKQQQTIINTFRLVIGKNKVTLTHRQLASNFAHKPLILSGLVVDAIIDECFHVICSQWKK